VVLPDEGYFAVRGQWAETLMGVIVLGVAVAFLIFLFTAGEFGGGNRNYSLFARFGQVGTLAQGADVRVAGVKVGTVTRVTLDPATFFARTQLAINPAIKLPTDSTAKIANDGLLGGVHVVIEPGGSPDDLTPGAEIQNTQGAVDLLGLIGQIVRPNSAPAETEEK
jgi:phospholipid/cholesterol/gamma-HCH transport system substrate-binding protein